MNQVTKHAPAARVQRFVRRRGKRLLALQNYVERFQFVRFPAPHRFGKDLVAIFRRDNNELIVTRT